MLICFNVFASCNHLNHEENQSEVQESNLVDLFNSFMRQDSFEIRKVIKLQDLDIMLTEKLYLKVTENSFLYSNGSIYSGDSIQIRISLKSNSFSTIKKMEEYGIHSISEVKYLIHFNVKDNNGNHLVINNKSMPKLIFHPSTGLDNSSYGFFDEKSKLWTLPVSIKKNVEKTTSTNMDELIRVIDHINGNDTFYTDNFGNVVLPKTETKSEIINYYLNLGSSGIFYVSTSNGFKNADVDLSIEVNTLNEKLNMDKVMIYIFLEDGGYKYYHKAKQSDGNLFYFDYASLNYKLLLPLNKKYKLLCYALDNEKCYLYFDKSLKLQKVNSLQINMQEVSFEKLKNALQRI